MARQFYTIDTYGGHAKKYYLLPFRFISLGQENELLVNEAGEYIIVPHGTARAVVRHELGSTTPLYQTLKARQFLCDDETSLLLDVLATKYRTKKSFLNGFTKLHIFVVTLRCDHTCQYCQVSRQTSDRTAYDMSPETASRSLALMMRAPGRHLTLELQGGEPLLAFDRIKEIVPQAKELAERHGKELTIVITTNLSPATDEMLRYFRQEGIKLSTSLDGPAYIHNANRPRPGNNSHEITVRNIQRACDVVGIQNVAALMTTTRRSLDHPVEIVDEYVRLGFRSIFLRAISPYGFAVRSRRRTGYEMDRFILFYKAALDHIIQLNRRGVDICEVYAKLLLTKILTPWPTGYVDLQSPAGAGIGVLVYNYNGDVYASDESRMLAEMHDTTFRLGNVHTHSYEELYNSPSFVNLMSASCNEALPGCADCAFQTYCGSDPVFHHATQGDLFGHRPSSAFCYKNMEILKHLFELIARDDRELMRIFFSWIREQSVENTREQTPVCA
jgi:His-Xaa-Ser system radical SAM maturase HxsB